MQDELSGFLKYAGSLTRFGRLYTLQKSFTQFSDGFRIKISQK